METMHAASRACKLLETKDQTELHAGGEKKEGIKSQACTHARDATHSKEVVDWKVHTREERDFLRKEVISRDGCEGKFRLQNYGNK
jgi:hypothetical protein